MAEKGDLQRGMEKGYQDGYDEGHQNGHNEGYQRVMEDGAEGILVPPRDVTALVDALRRLNADPEMRLKMGQRGQIKAARYSWAKLAEQVFAIYQQAHTKQHEG